MKELNLAEILKDCPQGTKLYSPICGECTFEGFDNDSKYPIIVCATDRIPFCFTADGRYFCNEDAEYLLFPSKDQRDWSTFQRPFKDGDILTTDLGSVFMLKETSEKEYYYSCYIALNHVSRTLGVYTQFCAKKDCRLATEEEKQELFQAIKENGYKWNAETKTLEKLIEPKFKVGNRIKNKTDKWLAKRTIKSYDKNLGYFTTINDWVRIEDQDNWELVPNKFDITTLVPFESKVLVRHREGDNWRPAIFGCKVKNNKYPFYTMSGWYYEQCIPYEVNKELSGTIDDCDEYYKTWEE